MITGMPRIAIAVQEFEEIVALFRDKFGMPVIDFSESSQESLGAKLAMCVPPGGSNIELMSPAVPEAPLSQSLQSFLEPPWPRLVCAHARSAGSQRGG